MRRGPIAPTAPRGGRFQSEGPQGTGYALGWSASVAAGGCEPMASGSEKSETSPLMLVARGEADAVEEMLTRYRPLVWSIVKNRVPSDIAEDVVQEVFINLWKSAGRFDPSIASEATFVSMIARRRLVDRQRRERARLSPEALPEEVPSDFSDFEAVDTKDEAARAERALADIRPEEQQVLRMSISGMSHSEIARHTRTPLGTVKSHARRGLERGAPAAGRGRFRVSATSGIRPRRFPE